MNELLGQEGISKKKIIGKGFSIFRGWCQKVLINKMKSDPGLKISEQSGNPLLLIQVTKKHILSQIDDMYLFASVHKHELHTTSVTRSLTQCQKLPTLFE